MFRFTQDQIRVKLGEYDFKQEGETGDKVFNVASMKTHEGVKLFLQTSPLILFIYLHLFFICF
jgi:hypothetical protein